MSKSLATETANDGEVLLPKREIAFKPVMKKMECNVCGKEADAVFHPTCDCNAGFRSQTRKAVEYAEKNPTASVRQIAKETDVSFGTAYQAKAGVQSLNTSESTTGRDGKTYPAVQQREPPPVSPPRDPNQAIIKQIMKLFSQLDWAGRSTVIDLIDQFTDAQLEREEIER